MTSEEKIIEITDLTKDFKEVKAVDSLSLNVIRGDVFGFLGPNGAGKSTTIRLLLTLIKPSAGTIKMFNKHLNAERKTIIRDVGAIIENPDFYKYLSAYKNLEILSRISGREIMKQRLGIAQALLHDPELIILDEPTTGLDPQGMKEIRDLITFLCKEKNKTIFLSSHILSEVEQVANRMIIINKGKKIVEGSVRDLLNAADLKVSVEVLETENAERLIRQSQWAEKLISRNKHTMIFNIQSDEIAELNKYLVENNYSVTAIVPTKSLESYFLKITEEAV
jgi:ABC-2 type transport system ATP-binding protein